MCVCVGVLFKEPHRNVPHGRCADGFSWMDVDQNLKDSRITPAPNDGRLGRL